MGNLGSSASATIQAIIGERFPLPPGPDGEERFQYGKVIGIFCGAVWVFLFIFILAGPEMTQDEREEEAEQARKYERMRKQGMSLREIGVSRAKGIDPEVEVGLGETHDSKKTETTELNERV